MPTFFVLFSLVLAFEVNAITTEAPSTFASWTPTYFRYCERLSSTNVSAPLLGGVACGTTAYYVMGSMASVEISSTTTLGLLNVGWITSEALKTQKQFWNTCKPYMVRLFDGIYNDISSACVYSVNPPSTLPSCTNTAGNLIYRTGSGYCMTQKICGASVPIDFLVSADGKSTVYSWETTTTTSLKAQGYTVVANCYGYAALSNPTKSDTTITTADGFY